MNLRFLKTSLFIGIFSCVAVLCRADVAFSDLSATSPYYDLSAAYDVVGTTAGLFGSQTVGAQFTAFASGGINSILLGLTYNPGGTGTVNVYLESVPPTPGLVNLNTAILLGTATTTTVFGGGVTQLTNVTLAAPGLISLGANQDYYLILQPSSPTTDAEWNGNNTAANGNVFFSSDLGATFSGGFFQTLPAFQIDVAAAVPEPSSLWVGVAAVIGALILRLRKKTSRPCC